MAAVSLSLSLLLTPPPPSIHCVIAKVNILRYQGECEYINLFFPLTLFLVCVRGNKTATKRNVKSRGDGGVLEKVTQHFMPTERGAKKYI
jgi:hypothetical protein